MWRPLTTCVFLTEYGGQLLLCLRWGIGYLIDAGMPGNAFGIVRQIKELGWKPERIGFILITHPDIDRVGRGLLKTAAGAPPEK